MLLHRHSEIILDGILLFTASFLELMNRETKMIDKKLIDKNKTNGPIPETALKAFSYMSVEFSELKIVKQKFMS